MSSYPAPSESITQFNTLLFNQPVVSLSQADADLLYLSKSKNDISTAGSTTFNGQVNVGGTITGSSLIQSNTTSISTNTLYNNLFSGSTLTIGTASSTNSINGTTNFGSGLSTFNNGINITTGQGIACDTYNPRSVTGTKSLFTTLTGTLNIGQATTTLINVKGPTTFDVDTTLSSRLNFNAAAYSFPFASNTSLGYVLKNTGSPTTITSATATTLTTVSIPIGVWRVDYAIQNSVTTAGTITAAQSYIATSAAPTTQLFLTGSIVRSHVSEVYTAGDIQVITSSFTLSVSTAQSYVLTILRTFATGAYSLTGEISITRLS
jgi:hypothetical protein